MEIHVQNQTAGVITYVEGNQVVHDGVHGSVVTDRDAWRAVGELREALPSVPLDRRRAAEARDGAPDVRCTLDSYRPERVPGSRSSTRPCAHRGRTRAGRLTYSGGSPSCWPAPDR